MRHSIGCNIVDMANQLSFAYRSIAPELRVFVLPPIKFPRPADFIRALEEKEKVCHKMTTVPITSNQYYNNFCRSSSFASSSFRPLFLSQLETFFCYQAQGFKQPSQQPWRSSNQLVNNNSNGFWCQAPLLFWQTFML